MSEVPLCCHAAVSRGEKYVFADRDQLGHPVFLKVVHPLVTTQVAGLIIFHGLGEGICCRLNWLP